MTLGGNFAFSMFFYLSLMFNCSTVSNFPILRVGEGWDLFLFCLRAENAHKSENVNTVFLYPSFPHMDT